jgi:hypothetical protein
MQNALLYMSEDELDNALLDNTFLPDYIKSITGIEQL